MKEATADLDEPSASKTVWSRAGVGNIALKDKTTGELAKRLEQVLYEAQIIQEQDANLPMPRVVDRTGLTGRYNFMLEYSRPAPPGFSPDDLPADLRDLFVGLREEFGLRLNKTTGIPVDVIVVDSVDTVPTPN